jgi:hypothetical protein
MSEPIPDSIPTSADLRSHRPLKRARGPASSIATTSQARGITSLFLDPSKEVVIPPPSTLKATTAAPPEIVANVQGSSAGAGSGEFHVYKASRRREYERLRTMDEEARNEEEQEEWEKEEAERKRRDEEATAKKREQRNRRKKKGKTGNGADKMGDDGVDGKENEGADKANGAEKLLHVPMPETKGDATGDAGIGVAKIAEEIGITIHDDD